MIKKRKQPNNSISNTLRVISSHSLLCIHNVLCDPVHEILKLITAILYRTHYCVSEYFMLQNYTKMRFQKLAFVASIVLESCSVLFL